MDELLRDPVRLEVLNRLRQFEPETDGTLERAARLASRLLGVPAVVCLVDAEGRMIPPGAVSGAEGGSGAEVGSAGEVGGGEEPPAAEPAYRGLGLATLAAGRPTFVPDARRDSAFASDPAVCSGLIVAYAGVPLYGGGQPIGLLVATHPEPIAWTVAQQSSMQDLAAMVMDEFELRTQIEERRSAERRLERARADAAAQSRLLRAVMRQLPAGLVVAAAPDGELTAANDEFRRLFGYQMLPAATIDEYDAYQLTRPDGVRYRARDTPLARALLHGETIAEEQLRYLRPDGVAIDLDARAAPVRDTHGAIVAAVGIFTDVTQRKRLQESVRVSQERMSFLSEASALVSSSLDPLVVITRLGRLVVDRLADMCAIVEPDQHGRLRRVAAVHRDPSLRPLVEAWLSYPPVDPAGTTPMATAFRERRTVRAIDQDPVEAAGRLATDPEYLEILAGLHTHDVLAVPLMAMGDRVGAIAFARDPGQPLFDDEEAALAAELAARFAVALANARRFEAEHSAAAELQRSLLPELSALDGLELAAVYLPSSLTMTIGGDFYDVLDLGNRRSGLAVGDVMGHGVQAAAAMGQLRAALRAYARLGMEPAATLSILDDLVADLPGGMLVTCLYGAYDAHTGRLTLASAGHLPPLLRLATGEVRTLEVAPGPPLGARTRTFTEVVHELPPGALLAMFSDGLVEERRRDLEVGRAALAGALADYGTGPLPATGEAVLRAMGRHGRNEDDVALLLVRAEPSG